MGEAKEQNKEQPEGKGIGPTRSFHSSVLGPGSKIGHFHIEQELGRGGMGVVYLARDITLGRPIAIKSLPIELMSNQKIRSRLEREARLLASLSHPNIAAIYEELEEAEGAIYLILEYIDGQTLAERIATGSLEIQEVVSIACQTASAVAAAHGHGIIHRDLKPGNIKITPEGNVKVLDFGLAKVIEEVETRGQQSTVTQPGRVIGTPAYMSPEQAVGDAVDYKTDIWSLGVVIYEMLTRELPFQGNTQQALTHSILHDKPKNLTRLRRDAPIRLEQVLSRLIQKDRLSRPDNMKVVVKELEAIRRDFVNKLSPSKRSPSIAVLPFVDISAESDQEYFCDGMAEELINALAQIKDLRVIARTSAFSYKGKDINVREIGRELDVATVLEGSVRKAGNRLRITAQLVDTTGGHHLWSERYDRNTGDVFAIQDEITLAIVDKLQPALLGEEKVKLAKGENIDIDAYKLYMMGRFFLSKQTEDGFKTAIDYFKLAIKQDPNYAPAFAGLADCHNLLGYYIYQQPKDAFPKAKEAALEALRLDSKLAEAHTSLGWILLCYEWDWERAENEFKQAIELNPNYATAHHWYSVYLFASGRFEESLNRAKRAPELDPLSKMTNINVGWSYFFMRRYDSAIEAFQKALLIEEGFWYTHWALSLAYFQKEMYEKSLIEIQKARDLFKGYQPRIESRIGMIYASISKKEEAQKVLKDLIEFSKQKYVPPVFIANIYFSMEKNDQGFEWLNKAFEVRDGELTWLRFNPIYDNIRSDPRYTALLRKMNIDSGEKK
jgi:serine/threonine protein kinase/Flp pilus assembly protein TadD